MLALTAQAQTNNQPTWYGYPQDRQVSALVGGLTGALSYSIIRSTIPDEPKIKSIGIASGIVLGTSLVVYAINGNTAVERRQNFTASILSGLSITLIFSLGI
jgi:hypothetical protein